MLNIVEIMNNMIISTRLIIAIIEPIIVNQFLEEGGSFIMLTNWLVMNGSKNRKLLDYSSPCIYKLMRVLTTLSQEDISKVRN